MNNKVLVKLVVPEMDLDFDTFIPVNETVLKIKEILSRGISDITSNDFGGNSSFILINKDSGRIYKNSEIIIDTDIRNSTELIFLSK